MCVAGCCSVCRCSACLEHSRTRLSNKWSWKCNATDNSNTCLTLCVKAFSCKEGQATSLTTIQYYQTPGKIGYMCNCKSFSYFMYLQYIYPYLSTCADDKIASYKCCKSKMFIHENILFSTRVFNSHFGIIMKSM